MYTSYGNMLITYLLPYTLNYFYYTILAIYYIYIIVYMINYSLLKNIMYIINTIYIFYLRI